MVRRQWHPHRPDARIRFRALYLISPGATGGTLLGMTRVALLLFDACDLIDVVGPLEVWLTANRLAERVGDPAPFEVLTTSDDGGPVTAYGGLGLTPHVALADLDAVDVLVVPGAIDIDGVLCDPRLIDLVRDRAGRDGVVAAVCTGAFTLAAAGLLDGRPFTTHFEDLDALAARVPTGEPRRAARWIDDGDVITSGGMTSGIAMALHLVERIAGRALAEETAHQIDYVWTERRA
jgi:transcriptional regulator GlxA family with amidase domain